MSRKATSVFAAFFIGLLTLISQLLVGFEVFNVVIALMPLAYTWIIHSDNFVKTMRVLFSLTAGFQILFLTLLFLEPMYFIGLMTDLYIGFIGSVPDTGIIVSVRSLSVFNPFLMTLVVFSFSEVFMDEYLRKKFAEIKAEWK